MSASPATVDRRVNENFNLARYWARKMGRFLDPNDAMSLAMEGLLKAAQEYEESPRVRFGTFASYRIKSCFAYDRRRRMAKCRGRQYSHLSFDQPKRYDNGGGAGMVAMGIELGDNLSDDSPDPRRMLELLEGEEKIDELLGLLTPHKRKIIEMHFGLHGGSPMFLEEIAAIYGVSRQRICQIKDESLRRFWRYLRVKTEDAAAVGVGAGGA